MYNDALMFKALGDPVRLTLLQLISQHNGQLNVFKLVDRLNAELDCNYAQPTVSHHLRILREAGFIEAYKHSQWKYYRVRSEAFLPILDTITALARGTRMEVLV